MITQIFVNGVDKKSLNLDEITADIKISSLSVVFDTTENAKAFVSKFPKSLKVKLGTISSYNNGVRPWVGINKLCNNKVTGIANESGDARISRFYAALKIELSNQ